MRKRILNALVLFSVQLFNYAAVAIYTRFVSQADYLRSCSLDAVFALVNFFVIKRIATSDNDWISIVAYVVGSSLGTFIGIWTTLKMVGH